MTCDSSARKAERVAHVVVSGRAIVESAESAQANLTEQQAESWKSVFAAMLTDAMGLDPGR